MEGLLSNIDSPKALKSLTPKELNELAREIRDRIIQVCGTTGGHLSSSLGAVDLIIALHYVFNSPHDRIIFDVGHQAYAHKILTGRNDNFDTLRQLGGISGFPKREESEHDPFVGGHASTAIAAALGFNYCDDPNANRCTIAVVGDGSLTGGLALTALNNAPLGKKGLIVVLNDNGMSISPNVGSISRYLTSIRAEPAFRMLDRSLRQLVSRFPAGTTLARAYQRFKESIFYFFTPHRKAVIFEELGFRYLGPFDGHNIELLIKVFKLAKQMDEPVLVHLVTTKGKGYKPAENNPVRYHGINNLPEIINPEGLPNKIERHRSSIKTYSEVFAECLIDLVDNGFDIYALTAAMPDGTGLNIFAKRYPERLIDVGIAEDFATTFAAGMAFNGKIPVVAIYSSFLQRAYDSLIHDIALQKAPVVFAIDRAGLVGNDGETHQGNLDLSYLSTIPNMIVSAPADENELRRLILTAVKYRKGPFAIRYPRGSGYGVRFDNELVPIKIGSWKIKQNGQYVLLLAVGSMVYPALEASKMLEEQLGFSPTVVNCRFIKPIDEQLLTKLLAKHQFVVTIEENVLTGGFGSSILTWLHLNEMAVKSVLTLGLPDKFIAQGTQEEQLANNLLNAKSIYEQILKRYNQLTANNIKSYRRLINNG